MTRNAVPENETKKEKFMRLAKSRMTKAIENIRLLKNLASPNYEYDSSNCDKIRELLKAEVDISVNELEEYLKPKDKPVKEKESIEIDI